MQQWVLEANHLIQLHLLLNKARDQICHKLQCLLFQVPQMLTKHQLQTQISQKVHLRPNLIHCTKTQIKQAQIKLMANTCNKIVTIKVGNNKWIKITKGKWIMDNTTRECKDKTHINHKTIQVLIIISIIIMVTTITIKEDITIILDTNQTIRWTTILNWTRDTIATKFQVKAIIRITWEIHTNKVWIITKVTIDSKLSNLATTTTREVVDTTNQWTITKEGSQTKEEDTIIIITAISIRINSNRIIITKIQIDNMLLNMTTINNSTISQMRVDIFPVKIKVIILKWIITLKTIIKVRKIIYQVIGPFQMVRYSMILVLTKWITYQFLRLEFNH